MSDRKRREFDSDDSNIYDVEFVYGKKMFKKQILYAVKWLGWAKSQMTWEPFSSFTSISSYLVRRLETRLSYAQYYKKIAPSSGGIRVHIKGKFCQVQQNQAKLQQKSIESEKKITAHTSDTQDIYDKAQKIITQMKQNLLCSNNSQENLKSQKKVKKQNNHLLKIINSQEKNQTISHTGGTVIGQEKVITKQINKKRELNTQKIIDLELERDIEFLIKNEKLTKKSDNQKKQTKIGNFSNSKDYKQQQQQQKQKQQQQQQQQQQKQNLYAKQQDKQKNNNQLFCEFQIILNEYDNSELNIPLSKQVQTKKNAEKQLKLSRNTNNQQKLKQLPDLVLGISEFKVKKTTSTNVQETQSYPQEESFEIDLVLIDDSEQKPKEGEKQIDMNKLQGTCAQNVATKQYPSQNNQQNKLRVVKSVQSSKTNRNNSETHSKTGKQSISEIKDQQQKRQVELSQGLTLNQLLQLEPKTQSNQKTTPKQQAQQDIQNQQQEKLIVNTTSRCCLPIIQKLQDFEVQQLENNLLNVEMVQYDLDLNEIRFQKQVIEIIESHHLIMGKLLFNCIYDNGMKYYVEYDKLKTYCPTLLLDYMIVNSILI